MVSNLKMLSNTCKYGIRAVIYLAWKAGEDERMGIKTISNDLGIPTPFLGKILQTLVRHKILKSSKGPHGGFSLAKPAGEISMLDIIYIIDGSDFFDMCLIDVKSCVEIQEKNLPCALHETFKPVRKEIYRLFRDITIENLVNDLKKDQHLRI